MQSTSLFSEAALGQKGIPIPFSGKTEKSNFLIKKSKQENLFQSKQISKKKEKKALLIKHHACEC
jgi:hypothetical protein